MGCNSSGSHRCCRCGVALRCGRRFSVDDDPRIDQVEGLLPRPIAADAASADAVRLLRRVAMLRRWKDCHVRVRTGRRWGVSHRRWGCKTNHAPMCAKWRQWVAARSAAAGRMWLYDRQASCVAVAAIGSGESLCSYGCVGMGDCVGVCPFDAISVNSETKIPEVDHSRCTGCGRCAERCPRSVISIRQVRVQAVFTYVACSNASPGQLAVKACRSACIACGKCERVCASSAITFGRCGDGVSRVAPARIDAMKCTGCGMW